MQLAGHGRFCRCLGHRLLRGHYPPHAPLHIRQLQHQNIPTRTRRTPRQERHARFRPNLWNELTPDREQLDVDIPDPKPISDDPTRDEWKYEAPDRDFADVQEDATRQNRSLSTISLRWMIK
ncbi:hypothetical protein F5887DRAFT_1075671 [Amanita rubescens]|nr:hypothetical protein F5887DRAFT_1075671 [Amanita rubescens]